MDTGDCGPNAGVNAPFPWGRDTSKLPRPGHVTENWFPFLGAAVAIGAARSIAAAATPPATAILLLFVIGPPPRECASGAACWIAHHARLGRLEVTEHPPTGPP